MAETEIDRVIDGGFCIGCGVCSAISPEFEVNENNQGALTVTKRPANDALRHRAGDVCPFANAPNEDEIARSLFGYDSRYTNGIGFYRRLYAGHSVDMRAHGGSGGISRWLVGRLFDRKEIDYAVVVANKTVKTDGSEPLFEFKIFDTKKAYLRSGSKSAYYPVTLQSALREIRSRDGQFLVSALPCFARALRSLAKVDEAFDAKIKYILGVICGGLKTKRYAEYLGNQLDVPREQLASIDFRDKSLSETAKEKCVAVTSVSGEKSVEKVKDLHGSDYSLGYFKPKPCDYCDDLMAETADISFGDAWLPEYIDDSRGTNLVIVRNASLEPVIMDGITSGELVADKLEPDEVIRSQGGGLRHRRDGLKVRLAAKRLAGAWAPKKRVEPSWGSAPRVRLQGRRVAIRRMSNLEFLGPSKKIFTPAMLSAEHVLLNADRLARVFDWAFARPEVDKAEF